MTNGLLPLILILLKIQINLESFLAISLWVAISGVFVNLKVANFFRISVEKLPLFLLLQF